MTLPDISNSENTKAFSFRGLCPLTTRTPIIVSCCVLTVECQPCQGPALTEAALLLCQEIWLGKMSPKWPVLCRVGCKTLISHSRWTWVSCCPVSFLPALVTGRELLGICGSVFYQLDSLPVAQPAVSKTVAWLHPFLIFHWTSGGGVVCPFKMYFKCKYLDVSSMWLEM